MEKFIFLSFIFALSLSSTLSSSTAWGQVAGIAGHRQTGSGSNLENPGCDQDDKASPLATAEIDPRTAMSDGVKAQASNQSRTSNPAGGGAKVQ